MRKQMLWVLCGLAVAVPAYSLEKDPCKRNQQYFNEAVAKCGCAEQAAEGKAVTCTGEAVKDIKPTKKFAELLKACNDNCGKGASSSSTTKEPKPAAETKSAAAADPNELPEGAHKCRGVDAKGNVLATYGTDKSSMDCMGGIKEAVGEKLCGGDSLAFTLQTYRDGKWSKGIDAEARCKKRK